MAEIMFKTVEELFGGKPEVLKMLKDADRVPFWKAIAENTITEKELLDTIRFFHRIEAYDQIQFQAALDLYLARHGGLIIPAR